MIGKDGILIYGLNIVIILLYYVLQSYGFGEMFCKMYCDNCVGDMLNFFLIIFCSFN